MRRLSDQSTCACSFMAEILLKSLLIYCCCITKINHTSAYFIICFIICTFYQEVCDGVGGASWQRPLLYKDRQESHDCQWLIVLWSCASMGQKANPLFTDVPVGTHHQQPSVQPVLQHHPPICRLGLRPVFTGLQKCRLPVLEITMQ